jgi:PIN domain nuclease of toxin-antitoxin system
MQQINIQAPARHPSTPDRILVAQAVVEGILLLTSDALVARYAGPIRAV